MDLTGDFIQQLAKLVPRPEVVDIGNGERRVLGTNGSLSHIIPAEQLDTAPYPHRVKQSVVVRDADSFIRYWTLYRDENTRVFADRDKQHIVAVLDYHRAQENARWGSHKLTLALRFSEEWQTWAGKNGAKMPQMEFAEFLEDNALDVVEPSGASMVELASTMQAKSDVEFESAGNLQNGQVQLTYREELKGSWSNKNMEIPRKFKILVPVYDGQQAVSVDARIRYRLAASKVTFWYQLHYKERLERQAFSAIVDQLAQAGVSIFQGTL